MLLTPLYLNLEKCFYPQENKKNVPKNNIDYQELKEPLLGNINYYIVIHPPPFNVSINSIPFDSLKIHIPNHPLVKNKLRLKLPPSQGFGLTFCYRVEYWQWRKPYIPENQKTLHKYKIKESKISEEYWWIPSLYKEEINNRFYLSFRNYRLLHDYPVLKYIELIKGETLQDSLLNHLDLIEIVGVTQNNITYSNYTLIDTSIPDTISEPPDTPVVALDWSNSSIVPKKDSKYFIYYLPSLTKADILWINEDPSILKNKYNLYYDYCTSNNTPFPTELLRPSHYNLPYNL